MKKVTRNDVARLAGVSSATVSRVFNGVGNVVADTDKAVRKAAQKLGYMPNKHASALSRPGGSTILMLERYDRFRDEQWDSLSWVWAESVRAVRDVINETMFSLELRYYRDDEDFRRIITSGKWAGILLNYIANPELLDIVVESGIPYVYCGRDPVADIYNCCASDDVAGGRLIAQDLKGQGAEKPLCIGLEHLNNSYVENRLQGFKEIFPATPVRSFDRREQGDVIAREISELIKAGKVDSIFVVSSVILVKVFYSLLKCGINVEEGIILATYDKSPVLAGMPIPVSTVDSCYTKLFTVGAEELLKNIKNREKIYHLVTPELVKGIDNE